MLGEIAALKARIAILELRPELRILDKDKPETWPPDDDSRVLIWRITDPRYHAVTSARYARLDRDYLLAWMPIPALPGA